MNEKRLLAKINRLNKQMNDERKKLEDEGYQVISVYNKSTNKDELKLVKKAECI